jgi:hypothetical protein
MVLRIPVTFLPANPAASAARPDGAQRDNTDALYVMIGIQSKEAYP